MEPFTFCLGVGVSGSGLGLTGMAGATATFTAASTTASVATASTAATAATVATATAATAAVASSPVWIPALAGAAVVGAAAAVTAGALGVLWPEAEANAVLREFSHQDVLDATGNFTSKLGGVSMEQCMLERLWGPVWRSRCQTLPPLLRSLMCSAGSAIQTSSPFICGLGARQFRLEGQAIF